MMSYSSFARKNFFVLYQKLSFAAQPLQPSSPFVAFKTLGGVDDAAECRHAVYGSWRWYRCLWCGGMCIPLFAVCHMILTSAFHPTICHRHPSPVGRIACVRPVAQNENSLRNNSLAFNETVNQWEYASDWFSGLRSGRNLINLPNNTIL